MKTQVTQAILLVAGRGSRLAPLTDQTPKCMLDVNGETLLVRLLKQLHDNGIEVATLVTGYLSEKIEEGLNGVSGIPEIRYADNPTWHLYNNADSLRIGMEAANTDRFLLCDGDLLLCDDTVIGDLLQDERPNILGASLQLPRNLGEEEMKFQLAPIDIPWGARRVTALSKELDPRFSHGESMGMQVISKDLFKPLLNALTYLSEEDRKIKYYEDVFATLIHQENAKFFALAIEAHVWTEIDTAEDLEAAKNLIANYNISAAI